MADDAHLLRRFVEDRSEEAFAALVERHLGLVYHAALRRLGGDTHLAQEVAQAVFVQLAQRAQRLTEHPSLAGWLHTTTHFKAAEARRAEHRRHLRETAAHAMSELLDSSPAVLDWERLRPVLDDVLLELNHADREAVLLRFFEGRAFAEIAARLAIPEKTAHKRVERALDKLRERLARRGLTSTVAALGLCLSTQSALAAPTGLATSVTSAALAAPVATASLGGTLISFMSTTKATVTAAVIVLGLAGALTFHEVGAYRESQALHVAQTQENAKLEAQARASLTRLTQIEAENTALAAKAKASAATAVARATPAGEDDVFPRDGSAFLKAHPEVREALIVNLRGQYRSFYAELFEALRLNEQDIEEFVRIQSLATTSIVGPNLLCNIGDKPLTGPEVAEQMRTLLGEDGYQLYRNHSRTNIARELVTELASSVYFSTTPLTSAQAGQLKEIVNAVMAAPPDDKPIRSGWRQFSPAVWDDILARSSGVLPEPQLAILRGLRQQSAFQVAQSTALQAYHRAAASKPTIPPAK